MLVLTRNKGQSIIIGEDIKVMILDTHGQQVKVGIDAPKKISVHREEIFDLVQKEKMLNLEAKVRNIQEAVNE